MMYDFSESSWELSPVPPARERGAGSGRQSGGVEGATRPPADENHKSAGLSEGWLIQRVDRDAARLNDAAHGRYLQIGTGQWCGAPYATLFPLRSAALMYAKEYGYMVGRHVQLVRVRMRCL